MSSPQNKRSKSTPDAEVAIVATPFAIKRVMRQIHPQKKLRGTAAVFVARLCVLLARRMLPENGEFTLEWLPTELRKHAQNEAGKARWDRLQFRPSEEGRHLALVGPEVARALEYLVAEILELVGSKHSVGDVWASHIHSFLSNPAHDDELCLLFSRSELDSELARCGIPREDGDAFWWESQDNRHAFINLWLHSSGVPLDDPTWKAVHAEYIGSGGQLGEDWGEIGTPCTHEVVVQDAAGTRTRLHIEWSDGNADANTGIFGHIFSDDGVWGVFKGHRAGDCGTLVESTDLARAFMPYSSLERLPDGAVWNENLWDRQVEALMFAWAMLARTAHARRLVPPTFKHSLTRSLIRLLGPKIEPRLSRHIWMMIADLSDISVPNFFMPELVSRWREGERNAAVLSSLRNAPYMHVQHDLDAKDETWPSSALSVGMSYEAQLKERDQVLAAGKFERAREMADLDEVLWADWN